MTKVVIQDRGYWLGESFWRDADAAGCAATLVEVENGVLTARAITREEFAARFTGRVANWVKSEHKSVSVFREALAPERKRRVTELFRESVVVGLETVAGEFTARTGAQGKVRLPAEASFVVVVHANSKDGGPQLHAHVAVEDRVRVRGQDKTYATHKRELYQLRELFAAAASHHFAHRLEAEFGVRVEKTNHGVTLPDVPRALCRRSSVRTKQIDEYIKAHALTNSPLTRKYAAIVTRRENRDPEVGRRAFQAELVRSGFRSEQACRTVSPDRLAGGNRPSMVKEVRRVKAEAKRLANARRSVTRIDLLTKALETAPPRQSVSRVRAATDAVLRTPNAVGLRKRENAHGQPAYVSRRAAERWKKIARTVEFVFKAERPPPKPQGDPGRPTPAGQDQAKPDGAAASRQSRRAGPEPDAARAAERGTDLRRVVETVLRSYRVVGAVGRVGVEAVRVVVELYRTYAKPVWRVHGSGHRNTPGSVAKMVRDLKPLPMVESHKAAILAMLKLNGTLDQKLRYGEYVYRQSRKAKFRVPRKSLLVIRDVGSANPKDVAFLLKKAGRAKAKVLFVEREHSRFALLQAATPMKPGEARHFPGPEVRR